VAGEVQRRRQYVVESTWISNGKQLTPPTYEIRWTLGNERHPIAIVEDGR
jgi:hypothetical protein